MYICLCNAVTENDIQACVREGACSLSDLQRCLGVGTCCGRCTHAARQVLHELRDDSSPRLAAGVAPG
ncbi:MAG: (2Fe-2S)-binding protein [Betaproteobacteria bacterium]|nr:(2Fe-2S)-binding protein [Betaproteobacteria bacterium]